MNFLSRCVQIVQFGRLPGVRPPPRIGPVLLVICTLWCIWLRRSAELPRQHYQSQCPNSFCYITQWGYVYWRSNALELFTFECPQHLHRCRSDSNRQSVSVCNHHPQMLTKTILLGARTIVSRRSFGVCVPAAQKVSDPIQQLFLDKIRDYKSKSK